jgi:hypothetical protein
MVDGRSHFRNEEVASYCASQGSKHITTPAYAPWTNGLVDNANKILLGRLKRLYAPEIDNLDRNEVDRESVPASWTTHLDEAI